MGGEKRRFWIPSSLAFGDEEDGSGKVKGPLVFDVELYGVERQPKPPDELTGPPSNATFTSSGLAYQIIKPGTGKQSPSPQSKITALYNGWTSTGELFLSTAQGAQTNFL